jgi:hypothetical protein
MRPSIRYSPFARARPRARSHGCAKAPGSPSANAVLAHLARLRAVRELALPAELGRDVHQNRLLRLAREGAQTAVYQIQEYETSRRYATLVAILLDTMATLTDETLLLSAPTLAERRRQNSTSTMIGSFWECS